MSWVRSFLYLPCTPLAADPSRSSCGRASRVPGTHLGVHCPCREWFPCPLAAPRLRHHCFFSSLPEGSFPPEGVGSAVARSPSAGALTRPEATLNQPGPGRPHTPSWLFSHPCFKYTVSKFLSKGCSPGSLFCDTPLFWIAVYSRENLAEWAGAQGPRADFDFSDLEY